MEGGVWEKDLNLRCLSERTSPFLHLKFLPLFFSHDCGQRSTLCKVLQNAASGEFWVVILKGHNLVHKLGSLVLWLVVILRKSDYWSTSKVKKIKNKNFDKLCDSHQNRTLPPVSPIMSNSNNRISINLMRPDHRHQGISFSLFEKSSGLFKGAVSATPLFLFSFGAQLLNCLK